MGDDPGDCLEVRLGVVSGCPRVFLCLSVFLPHIAVCTCRSIVYFIVVFTSEAVATVRKPVAATTDKRAKHTESPGKDAAKGVEVECSGDSVTAASMVNPLFLSGGRSNTAASDLSSSLVEIVKSARPPSVDACADLEAHCGGA